MSAFMVDDAHIDVIIDIAYQYRSTSPYNFSWARSRDKFSEFVLDDEGARCPPYWSRTPNDVGRMLLAENARAVGHRYREGQHPAALTYVYRPTRRTYTANTALKTIACYTYQIAEPDDWHETEAYAFCEALTAQIVRMTLPFNDADPWGWSDDHLGRSRISTKLF